MSSDLEATDGPDDGATPSPSKVREGRRTFRSLTVRQRLLLIGVLAAVPLVLFLVAEAGLRLAGYGSDYPLFVPTEPAPRYLQPNPELAQRYFRHEAGTPRPMVDLFRAEKAPGTYRIFVQGGSTTAGFPYNHGGAFSRMLEQRLQETFPETEIEVVNVSLDATNSYTLRDLAPEILEQAPDAVLIYAGHNEYYGVLGVASAESVGRARWVVRSYIALRKLRTVQWLQDAVAWGAGVLWSVLDRETPPTRTLMEYLASESTVRYGSPEYRAGIRQLRSNLDDLLGRYAAAGVPVFIGTLASNERGQPPFVSRPVPEVDSTAWDRLIAEARTALEAGDSAAAAAALHAAVSMDSTPGDPFFLRGRLLDRGGSGSRAGARDTAARTAYRAARDRDQLPFRAPTPMNAVIREVAERHGAVVVETQAALADVSPGGIVDHTVMLEHLHPNIEGQFRLADAFYDALRSAGEVGEWSRVVEEDSARKRVPVTAVDSVAGALMIARLTARFPFQPQDTTVENPVDTIRPDDPIERIALMYHRGELGWLRAMGRLQDHYWSTGQLDRVIHVNRVTAQEVAYSPFPLVIAAEAAVRLGRDDEAARYLAEARTRGATAEGARLSGTLAARRGDRAEAVRQLQRAVRLDRTNRRAQAALQALQAIPELEAAVARDSSDLEALTNLGATYLVTGRYEQARELVARVLRASPDHSGANRLLRELQSYAPTPQNGME